MSRYKAEEPFNDTACGHCSRMSSGLAYRDGTDRWSPLVYVCKPCSEFMMELRDVRDLERIERDALPGGVALVAKYLAHINCTNLDDMTEEDALMIVKYAVEGFGDEIRRLAATGKY